MPKKVHPDDYKVKRHGYKEAMNYSKGKLYTVILDTTKMLIPYCEQIISYNCKMPLMQFIDMLRNESRDVINPVIDFDSTYGDSWESKAPDISISGYKQPTEEELALFKQMESEWNQRLKDEKRAKKLAKEEEEKAELARLKAKYEN